jgi:hypothetical protein
LLVVPLLFWAQYGQDRTVINWKDILKSTMPSVFAAAAATLVTLIAGPLFAPIASTFVRLTAEATAFLAVYLFFLLFVMRQLSLFQSFVRELGFRRRALAHIPSA